MLQRKQHSLITKTEALVLLDRVNAARCALAVFARGKSYICTKINTDRFVTYMGGKQAKDLMGVYDHDVRLEWLEDDLAYMGVR